MVLPLFRGTYGRGEQLAKMFLRFRKKRKELTTKVIGIIESLVNFKNRAISVVQMSKPALGTQHPPF